MRALGIIALLLGAGAAAADTVIATRTIRPNQVVTSADVRVDPARIEGAHTDLDAVIGQEARVAIYPGRAVMKGTLGEPALIDRNQVIELIYEKGGLRIVTEARALGRGGVGERIRVMNMGSRAVLFGTIQENGTVRVSQ